MTGLFISQQSNRGWRKRRVLTYSLPFSLKEGLSTVLGPGLSQIVGTVFRYDSNLARYCSLFH